MRRRWIGLFLLVTAACNRPPPAEPPSPFAPWSPRQVRATARVDGTVEEELLRPDRTVSVIATVRREHALRLRGLDPAGRELWDCDTAPKSRPRCALRDAHGQLHDAAAVERANQAVADQLFSLPSTAAPRSARDRRWLERIEQLTAAGLPLAVAAPLAREELASGFYYFPERQPISDADHWH